MAAVTFRVLGSGDAFASGGRLQTCFHVVCGARQLLIDCGATALVGAKRFGVDPAAIDAILISHLHGDHIGGLPFLLLHGQHVARRTRPLVIAGPEGTGPRLAALLAAMFPGAGEGGWRFPLEIVELRPGVPATVVGVRIEASEVVHPAGAPPLALRVHCDGRIIAYSGDTQWTDVLPAVGRDADLFVCECYAFDQPVANHLSYQELRTRLGTIGAKRVLLTHMSEPMLARLGDIDVATASDGMVIELD
jgi:ribonuclease BN (tRNA processing enzyme)